MFKFLTRGIQGGITVRGRWGTTTVMTIVRLSPYYVYCYTQQHSVQGYWHMYAEKWMTEAV
jgi:hypothetical protein